MPVNPSTPGVEVQEVPGGVRTITGVATSVTAFIGRTLRGPADRPQLVQSVADFERVYGGLWRESPLSYAVQHYFVNGGRDAVICRVHHDAAAATLTLPPGLRLQASSPGSWGNGLRVRVAEAPAGAGEAADSRFDLWVKDSTTGSVEAFLNLSTDPAHHRFATAVIAAASQLVTVSGPVPTARPAAHAPAPAGTDPWDCTDSSSAFGQDGDDGGPVVETDISADGLEAGHQGLWLLDHADIVNLICVPPLSPTTDVGKATWDAAIDYAQSRRAVVVVDPPSVWTGPDSVIAGLDAHVTRHPNAALYFPRLNAPDPLRDNQLHVVAPSGAVAGVIARTDAQHGVWKAPAGVDASLRGMGQVVATLTDAEIGRLNPLGVNCVRPLPGAGSVVWGARTLAGADDQGGEWKYLPVRRTALFIEESLVRGLQWVVFEPNDEPLWSKIRLSAGAFLNDLFRQGAFQGTTAREAWFVRCDADTTTRADVESGIVTVVVGFAPLKPGEFVVTSLRQRAGQVPDQGRAPQAPFGLSAS